jgi:hypothetical protein
MDDSFPESEAGQGMVSKLGVDTPTAAKRTFQVVTGRLGLGAGSRELVTRRGTAQERGLEIRSVGRG